MGGRLRNAAISREYRRNMRDAALFLLGVVAKLGGRVSRRTDPRVLDEWLERGVEEMYRRGEKP